MPTVTKLKYLLFFLVPLLCFSHSGRTDSRGGHNDNINGGYHYHHGCSAHSHSGGCPYDYENCRNGGSRSSYKSKNNWYVILYVIGGLCVLFIVIPNLWIVFESFRDKERKLKNERLQKDKRHKTYLYLKGKQYNQNDEYIPNQLTAEENIQYNELKEEFAPKPRIEKKIKEETVSKPTPLTWESLIDTIYYTLDFEWIKYKWIRILLRIIAYPFYLWGLILVVIFVLGGIIIPIEWLYKFLTN